MKVHADTETQSRPTPLTVNARLTEICTGLPTASSNSLKIDICLLFFSLVHEEIFT